MSVITVMLFANYLISGSSVSFRGFGVEIGGMNSTELYDMKQLATLDPVVGEVEQFGFWSAQFTLPAVSEFEAQRRESSPPVKHVAPFLSKIKTWGYQITFYEKYQDTLSVGNNNIVPAAVHTWMLEIESEIIVLPPPPPTTTTITTDITDSTPTTAIITTPTTMTPSTTIQTTTTNACSTISNLTFKNFLYFFIVLYYFRN